MAATGFKPRSRDPRRLASSQSRDQQQSIQAFGLAAILSVTLWALIGFGIAAVFG